MHQLATMSFLLGATLKSNPVGQILLQPSAIWRLELVRRGDAVVKGELIQIEIEHPDQLEELANTLLGTAAELRKVVVPLTQPMDVTHEAALEMARKLVELLKDSDANAAEIEVQEHALRRAGWDPEILKRRLAEEAPAGEPAPQDGFDGFAAWFRNVQGNARQKGGTFPEELLTEAVFRPLYERGLGILEAIEAAIESELKSLSARAAVEQTQPEQEQQESGDEESGEYEYVTCDVTADGDLSFRYKCVGVDVHGSQGHDEDVSDWSDDDIIECAMMTLSIPEHQRSLVKIERD